MALLQIVIKRASAWVAELPLGALRAEDDGAAIYAGARPTD
jgi:hypothetical protein